MRLFVSEESICRYLYNYLLINDFKSNIQIKSIIVYITILNIIQLIKHYIVFYNIHPPSGLN